jgi:hypothetical protein
MPPIQYSQTKIMGWFSGAYMTVENPPDQRESEKPAQHTEMPSLFAEWTRASKPVVTGSIALNKSATRGGLIKKKRKAAE